MSEQFCYYTAINACIFEFATVTNRVQLKSILDRARNLLSKRYMILHCPKSLHDCTVTDYALLQTLVEHAELEYAQ